MKDSKTLFHKYFVLLFLIVPFTLIGQVSIDAIPLNKQLVARDVGTNLGKVIIGGTVDKTGVNPDYDAIEIDVFKNNEINAYQTQSQSLDYGGGTSASFSINIFINAEFTNYSFKVFGKIGSIRTAIPLPMGTGNDIVAGDVFVIQGQSNAVATMRTPPGESANSNQNNFIRTFASAIRNDGLLDPSQLVWNEAHGDGDDESGGEYIPGFVGQWGLKFARMIVDDYDVPVAIFNGAEGNTPISDFLKNAPNDQPLTKNNYNRLFIRLDKTGLKEHVRAVFWSQGESDLSTSTSNYYNSFLSLKTAWKSDYPNIEEFYLFQSKSACGTISLMEVKEAQRRLAANDNRIHIIQTAALKSSPSFVVGSSEIDCHFNFIGGYEEFANRVYELVKRDFYNGANLPDMGTPVITDAYLTDDLTLIVETDASALMMNNPVGNFLLENAGAATITDIQVSGNNIVFKLSANPGTGAFITHLGSSKSIDNDNFITNTNNLELVSFNKFPIGDKIVIPGVATWNGTSWSPRAPDSNIDAIIDGGYNASNGTIVAKNLTINSGVELNFDKGTSKSVIVYGFLTIEGTFILGDIESLVMYDDEAAINGVITKKESSQQRNETNDLVLWSSPISNADIATVFNEVSPNRIFYYDPSKYSASDPGAVWVVATGKMIPGVGIAAEGPTGKTSAHNISFTGPPNNGIVSVLLQGNFGDNDPQNDLNLIGNPYPSGVDIDLFLKENSTVIDPTIYIRSQRPAVSGEDFTSSNYVAHNNLGATAAAAVSSDVAITENNIGSAQGFFVISLKSGSVVFNNSMRIGDENIPIYEDEDGDGYTSNVDCDDSNAAINPGMKEILYNGIDDDCDPATPDAVDADGDGYASNVDCDDTDPAINPGATDIPNNSIDEDCDGKDATEEVESCTNKISANLNLNPAKSGKNIFAMKTPKGVIDMNTLKDANSSYSGSASWVKIRVKGKGSKLIVNGKEISLNKERNYEFSGDLSVSLKNEKKNKKGKSNGHWWITIEGNDVCFDQEEKEDCENEISANLNLDPKKSGKDMFTMVTPEGTIDMKSLLKKKGDNSYIGDASFIKIRVRKKGSKLIVNGKEIKIDKKHKYEFSGELSVSLTNSKKNKKGKKSKDHWWITIDGKDVCVKLDKKNTKNNDDGDDDNDDNDDDDKDDDDKSNGSKSASGKTNNAKSSTVEEQTDLIWLDLKTDRGGFNQILIGFTNKATNGVDKGYDALKVVLGDNPIDFYSIIENKKYVIQGLNRFSEDKTISLGYDSKVYPRTLTIGINKIEGELKDKDVYLVDNLLGITHELSIEDYVFEQNELIESSHRFTLAFSGANNIVLSTDNIDYNKMVSLVHVFNGYNVHSEKIINKVKVYDTLGRMLFEVRPDNNEFLLSTERVRHGSILLVEMILDNGIRVIRKVISY